MLLARRPRPGRSSTRPSRASRPLRDELNAGSLTFQELIEAEDLLLDVGGLHAFSHWITPEGAPRRYDTRFFLAAAPDGHAYLHDETETVASLWIRPADALAASDRGELELIFPTRKSLEALEPVRHRGRAARRGERRRRTSRRRPSPGSCGDPGGIRLLLPGDAATATARSGAA